MDLELCYGLPCDDFPSYFFLSANMMEVFSSRQRLQTSDSTYLPYQYFFLAASLIFVIFEWSLVCVQSLVVSLLFLQARVSSSPLLSSLFCVGPRPVWRMINFMVVRGQINVEIQSVMELWRPRLSSTVELLQKLIYLGTPAKCTILPTTLTKPFSC